MRLSAPVSSRAAVRQLGPSAARVPSARAVAEQPLGTSAPCLFFLFKNKQNKKTSKPVWERSDAQRTSPLLLSLLLSEPPCGLGRISSAPPTPDQRQPAGGRGSLSWCPPWSEGSRQNWVREPVQSGEGCL